MTRSHLPACLCAALLTTASCGESTEVLTREPGRLEGVVVLEGHEVACEDGVPTGQLVFELYRWAEPGARELLDSFGRGPEHVRVLPAADVFGESDCGGGAGVTHSGSFVVEEVGPEVGTEEARDYLVRVIYDRDGDYRAEPTVFRTPTRGDLIGGVVEALPAEGTDWSWVPVHFEAPVDHPDGQLVGGITALLGLHVDLEPPVSELFLERNLSSDATIPITVDSAEREQGLAALTGSSLRLHAGDALDRLRAEGLSLAREPEAMAWVIDETHDFGLLHPVLGPAGGVPWLTPLMLFERRRTDAEEQAGVPRVRIVASIRPTEILIKEVFRPSISVVVPPIADVVLTDDPECAIPLIPGGNEVGTYERIPVDCQELPTGPYDLRILHGVAGATAVWQPEAFSDIEQVWMGGAFAAQAWVLPNDLAIPGQDRGLWVVDGDPTSSPDPTLSSYGHGQDGCDAGIDIELMMPREIDWMPVPARCCEPIQHLCGLPLCDATPGPDDGTVVRSLTALDDDGLPPCVPFAMPASCCGA